MLAGDVGWVGATFAGPCTMLRSVSVFLGVVQEKRDKHEGKGSHRVSSSDEERSEAPAPNSAGLVREDWMTTPAPAAAGSPASDKAPKESQREDPDAVKIHVRRAGVVARKVPWLPPSPGHVAADCSTPGLLSIP